MTPSRIDSNIQELSEILKSDEVAANRAILISEKKKTGIDFSTKIKLIADLIKTEVKDVSLFFVEITE